MYYADAVVWLSTFSSLPKMEYREAMSVVRSAAKGSVMMSKSSIAAKRPGTLGASSVHNVFRYVTSGKLCRI